MEGGSHTAAEIGECNEVSGPRSCATAFWTVRLLGFCDPLMNSAAALISSQSMAYRHQYERSHGFQCSGPRAPLERLALAVTAIRCWGSSS